MLSPRHRRITITQAAHATQEIFTPRGGHRLLPQPPPAVIRFESLINNLQQEVGRRRSNGGAAAPSSPGASCPGHRPRARRSRCRRPAGRSQLAAGDD